MSTLELTRLPAPLAPLTPRDPTVGDRPLQPCFPIERFEDLERWIVERSAKVGREMAAQGATWTAPARAPENERRPA
jgi:hypothetical protein